MPGLEPVSDPALLEEFQFVEQVRTHFKSAGVSLAYWEAYCLSQINGPALRRAAARHSEVSGPPRLPVELLESLRLLRDRGAPVVSKVRRLLPSLPRGGEESDRMEMALGVLFGSERGREAVSRWVADPSRFSQEASDRVQGVMARLEPLYRVLKGGTEKSPEVPAPDPQNPPEPARPGGSPTPSLVPQLLQASLLAPAEIMIPRPGIPDGLVAAAAPGKITLTWKKVAESTGYNVKRANQGEQAFRLVGTTQECSFIDDKVSPAAAYLYLISATNEAGEGGDSPALQAAALPVAPQPPSGLNAIAGPHRIDLTWDPAPGSTSYHVKREESPGSPRTIVASVASTFFADGSVKDGATYGYAVCSVGPGGESPDSGLVTASVPAPLAAPSGVTAHGGSSRVVLRWNPVSGATGYVVSRAEDPGSPIAQVNGCAYQDMGLSNGTAYSYCVRAVGAAGESHPSAPVTATPVSPPPAPAGIHLTGDGQRLRLAWRAAPGALRYNVKRGPAPGGPYATILSGLSVLSQEDIPPSRGIKYYYVVTAVGPAGEGPASTEVSGALPVLPQPPAGLRATPGHGSVALDWSPSRGVLRYHVKRRVGSGVKYVTLGSPTEATFVDTTATAGTRYEYVVSAVAGSLESADSAPVKVQPLVSPPAPAGLSAQASNGRVVLAWNAVPGALEYRIQRAAVREGQFSEVARIRGSLSHVDQGVINGQTYDYVVVAVSAGGEGPTSARARATPASAPAMPRGFQGSASQGRVLLSWSESADATGYVVKRASSTEGPFLDLASISETTYTDSSVVNGSTYYYKVCASNAGGRGEEAGPWSATPMDPPAAPTEVTAIPGSGLILLKWRPSAGASGYTVKRATSPQGPFTTLGTPVECALEDRDVNPRTLYHYLVSAVNGAGRSPASSIVTGSPLSVT